MQKSLKAISCKLLVISYLTFSLMSCNRAEKSGASSGSAGNNGLPSTIVNIPATESRHSNNKMPQIKFDDTAYDFGTIKEGEKVSHSYTFTNKGAGDLVVVQARGSCGCTVATPPKNAIAPGGSGKIDVTFDSSNKEGKVLKEVYVTTNCAPNVTYLTFTANILIKN